MKLSILLVAVVSVAAGAAFVNLGSDNAGTHGASPASSSKRYAAQPGNASQDDPASAMERLERSIKMKAGTKKSLGDLELVDGRRLRLYSADTTDTTSCLIEDDPEVGPGAGCLEGGLFRARKVAFSVNSQGGPERFDELYLVGVAAPSIRAVAVVTTDGDAVPVRLNGERAFVFESSLTDLETRVYPTALKLYGQSGKLVETVTFPPAG